MPVTIISRKLSQCGLPERQVTFSWQNSLYDRSQSRESYGWSTFVPSSTAEVY